MTTSQSLYSLATGEVIHTDEALLFLGASPDPHLARHRIDLLFGVAAIDVAGLVLQLHQLLIRHPVDIGVVWVVRGLRVLRLLNRPLEQTFFLSRGLVDSRATLHRHHHHLSLL